MGHFSQTDIFTLFSHLNTLKVQTFIEILLAIEDLCKIGKLNSEAEFCTVQETQDGGVLLTVVHSQSGCRTQKSMQNCTKKKSSKLRDRER